jgi:peptidoglycan endopeptidase LytE
LVPFISRFSPLAAALIVLFLGDAASAHQLRYTVSQGDSLWTIASRFGVSVAALETRNHLSDSSVLQIGQTIVVADIADARTARPHIVHKTSPRHIAVHASASPAAKNAMWVATHTGEAPAPPTQVSFELAERIVGFDESITKTALRYVGVPYVWGGTTFSGVDCSGFVQAVFEHNGITLPRTADSQFEVGMPVKTRDLQPGDLVFFETYAPGASHVGIFLGNGRFIHASSYGVRVDDLAEDYYAERYLGARRLIH